MLRETASPNQKFAVAISLGEMTSTNMLFTLAAFKKLIQPYFSNENYMEFDEFSSYGFDAKFAALWAETYKKMVPLFTQFGAGWINSIEYDRNINMANLTEQQKETLVQKRFYTLFCKEVSKNFGIHFDPSYEEFYTAWCAMSRVTPNNAQDIAKLQSLSQVMLFPHSNTNPSHYAHISAQLKNEGVELEQHNLFLSYKTGKQGPELLNHVHSSMKNTKEVKACIFIIGDAKQVSDPIVQKIIHDRMQEIESYVSYTGDYYFVRKKSEDPSCSVFIEKCITLVEKELQEKQKQKQTVEFN